MTDSTTQTDAGNTPSADDICDVAVEMAEEGLPVFPLAKNKLPVWSNKALGLKRGEGGFKVASLDYDRIVYLFTDKEVRHRVAGIGVPTGEITGRTVIDVDCGKGKSNAANAAAWIEEHRVSLRGATVVRTQSGGLQYYVRYTPAVKNAANVWAKGVDARNDGGFVAVPPFMGYRFERTTDPDDWPEPPHIPKKIKVQGEVWDPKHPPGEVSQDMQDLILRMANGRNQGTWHDDMVRIVGFGVSRGMSDAEILMNVPKWTAAGYTDRQTFEEVATAIGGARAKKWGEKPMPETTDDVLGPRLQQIWNACSSDLKKSFLKAVGQ